MANPHITISAEPISYIGNFAVSNSIFTSFIASSILIILAIIANSKLKKTGRPQGLQNFLEMIIDGLYNLTSDISQSTSKTKLIFPVTTTFFIFILLNNWLGLLPGFGTIGINHQPEPSSHSISLASSAHATDVVKDHEPAHLEDDKDLHTEKEHQGEGHETFIPIFRAGTADLNTTIALALFSITYVQVLGFKYLGFSYLSKFFNFKNALLAFVGLLEFVSELSKIISFSFRLFGNIFAGEVLLIVIGSLLPAFAPIPFLFLEILVGVIQALVFAMLSIVFMTMATQSHDNH